jgi:mercuric ion transport protein
VSTSDVHCPDCGERVPVPTGAESGDLLDCSSCAGHALRLTRTDGRWAATLAHRVSCPACNKVLTLPEGAQAGDAVECCGRRYRLTLEYGAFAAEETGEALEARMWRDRGLVLGIIGTVLSCLACLTPIAVLALGAIGLGAWTGHLDAVLLALLVGFLTLVAYRYWRTRRPTP